MKSEILQSHLWSNHPSLQQEYFGPQLKALVDDLLGNSLEYSDRRIRIKRQPEVSIASIDHLRVRGGSFIPVGTVNDWRRQAINISLFSLEVIDAKRLRVSESTDVYDFVDQFVKNDPRFRLSDEELNTLGKEVLSDYDPNEYFYNPNINDLNIQPLLINFDLTKVAPHSGHVFVELGYLISGLQKRLIQNNSGLIDFRFTQHGISKSEVLDAFEAFINTCLRYPDSLRGAEFTIYPYLSIDTGENRIVFRFLEDRGLLSTEARVKRFLRIPNFPLRSKLWFNKDMYCSIISCGPRTDWWRKDE